MLEDRTKKFHLDVLRMCGDLPKTPAGFEIARQLIRSAGSVGANYRTSARSKSTADFINKIQIIIEEADESKYWLEILHEIEIKLKDQIKILIKEADSLTAIFTATNITAKRNQAKGK